MAEGERKNWRELYNATLGAKALSFYLLKQDIVRASFPGRDLQDRLMAEKMSDAPRASKVPERV